MGSSERTPFFRHDLEYHFLFFSSTKVNTDYIRILTGLFLSIASLNLSLRLQPVLRILPRFAASVLVRLPGDSREPLRAFDKVAKHALDPRTLQIEF